jgi:16S rRNA processing protein RimM
VPQVPSSGSVLVGRIVRTHGRFGAVVVQPETDFAAERFQVGAELLWERDGKPGTARLSSSREFRGRWIVTFEGVASMNDAEALRGLELRVPEEALHVLASDTHYVHDLEGCRVVTTSGLEVGPVVRVDFGSGTPLLAVSGAGGEVLVPLAADICRDIDVAAKRIVIEPPAGLLELNTPGAGRSRER